MENKQFTPTDVITHICGYWTTQAVYVVSRLGVCDHLKESPKTAGQLAKLTNTNPEALYRVMRAVASIGYLIEADGRKFSLGPLGEFLKSDHPATMRSFVNMHGDSWHWDAWGKLLDSVKTGKSGVEINSGMELFEFLKREPENTQTFSDTMSNLSRRVAPVIADAYPIAGDVTIVDVGGATGALLAEFLNKNTKAKGVLFDLPEVIAVAKTSPGLSSVKGRIRFEEGSFFEKIPSEGDIYLMKYILHDRDDSRASKILGTLRTSVPKSSKILIVEQLIQKDPGPEDRSRFVDLEMLAVTPGGRERTEQDFRNLLDAAGLSLNKIVPTKSPFFVLEVTV